MPCVLKHRVGSYVAREDVKEATNMRYTLDINAALVFQDIDEAQRYEMLHFAFRGMVETMELSIGDVMPL